MTKRDPADMGALLRQLVRQLCAEGNVTQAEVARRAGLDPASLCRSFGHRNCAAAVRAVCAAFGFRVQVVPDAKK